MWAANGQSFVTGSLDKQKGLRTWSINGELVYDWGKKHRVQDIAGSPNGRWIAAMDDNQTVHVYNHDTRELEYELNFTERPTSVSISEDSRFILVNRVDGEAQLFEIGAKKYCQKFLGHTGGKYVIRSTFGGANESFVVSGSEG